MAWILPNGNNIKHLILLLESFYTAQQNHCIVYTSLESHKRKAEETERNSTLFSKLIHFGSYLFFHHFSYYYYCFYVSTVFLTSHLRLLWQNVDWHLEISKINPREMSNFKSTAPDKFTTGTFRWWNKGQLLTNLTKNELKCFSGSQLFFFFNWKRMELWRPV